MRLPCSLVAPVAPVASCLLLALVLGACEPREVRHRPILRFIEDPAPPVFDAASLLGEEAVLTWSFVDPPPGPWQPREVESVRADGVGWWLEPQDQRVVLDLERVALRAEQVDVVAVRVEGRGLGGANLHWGPAGEPTVPERQLRLPVTGQARQTFLFRVGDHAQWRDEIGRLVITVWTAPGHQVGITSIKAVSETLAAGALEKALRTPWRVELAARSGRWADRRVAWVGWPGRPLARQLDVPNAAFLELAFGAFFRGSGERALDSVGDGVGGVHEDLVADIEARGTWRGPKLRFRVLVKAGEQVSVLADEIWRGQPGWCPLRLDLQRWAGSRVTLILEIEADVDLKRQVLMPFWADPEVLAPSDESRKEAPNVILIVADTLRADRLSLYGHQRATSPNLDAWAQEHGAVFESVVSSAGWTLPAHASIFTGLDAPRHGVNWTSSTLDESVTTLAEFLHAGGYATEAITGGGFLDPSYGLDRGFSRYRTWPRDRSSHEAEPPQTLSAALEALSRLDDRPFFLFIHTYATHWPYAPWQPHISRFGDTDPLVELIMKPPSPGDFRARNLLSRRQPGSPEASLQSLAEDQYDAGIARLDGLLRPLFAALGKQERNLVVFTSDHGEMLGERGRWGHSHIFDPTLKVPLVIAAPSGLGAGSRIGGQNRSVDLLPTILELLAWPAPTDLDGRSLVPQLRGDPVAAWPVAWSYGRRVENGLAIRLRDRLKLLLHDDVLSENTQRVRAFEVGPSPRQEREIEVPPELAPLIAQSRRRLLDELAGLHLHFSNNDAKFRGSESLRFEISSGAAVPERIKVPDLTCDCVEWLPPFGLAIEVPAGEAFTVVLTDVRDARLQMILKRPDGSRQRLTLDLTEHDRPLAMAVVDGSFKVSAGPPPGIGVGVRWNDARVIDRDDPTEDPEMLEALRSLGYIE